MSGPDTTELDRALREETLAEEKIFDGRLLRARRLRVRLPDGRETTREKLIHPGASAVVALDDVGLVLLERQWRAPMDRAFWEVPAGKIDPGERPEDTARRELREEAGVEAARWVHLGTIHNAIGYSDERLELYLAQELRPASQQLDQNEFLTLVRLPFEEALAMTADGSVSDVKTIIALRWADDWRRGRLPQGERLGAPERPSPEAKN